MGTQCHRNKVGKGEKTQSLIDGVQTGHCNFILTLCQLTCMCVYRYITLRLWEPQARIEKGRFLFFNPGEIFWWYLIKENWIENPKLFRLKMLSLHLSEIPRSWSAEADGQGYGHLKGIVSFLGSNSKVRGGIYLSNCQKSLKHCINIKNSNFYSTDWVLLIGHKFSPEYNCSKSNKWTS